MKINLRVKWSLQIPKNMYDDYTLLCMKHRRPMVAYVSLFEVANAPTNWYVYLITIIAYTVLTNINLETGLIQFGVSSFQSKSL